MGLLDEPKSNPKEEHTSEKVKKAIRAGLGASWQGLRLMSQIKSTASLLLSVKNSLSLGQSWEYWSSSAPEFWRPCNRTPTR